MNHPALAADLEVYFAIEATKIGIFLAQLIVIFVLIARLRDVREGLAEVRQALMDVLEDLTKEKDRS